MRSTPHITEETRKTFGAISHPDNAHLFTLEAALKAFEGVTPMTQQTPLILKHVNDDSTRSLALHMPDGTLIPGQAALEVLNDPEEFPVVRVTILMTELRLQGAAK